MDVSEILYQLRSRVGLLGFLILSIAFIIVVYLMVDYGEQLEQEGIERAIGLCESQNDTRTVLDNILQSLVEPRPEDEPGDYEERVRLYEQVEHLLQREDCSVLYAREVIND